MIAKYLKDDEALGGRVSDLFTGWMRPIQTNFHKKILYLYRLYHGYRPRAPEDGYSNIHVPLAETYVESIFPRIYSACTATEPPFHADPRQADIDRIIKGEIVENFIWENWRRSRRLQQFGLAIKDALICGTGVEKGFWNLEFDADGSVRKDRCEFRRISILDLAWDPAKTHADDTPIIHWQAMRLHEIEEMAEINPKAFKNIEQLRGAVSGRADKTYNLNDLYMALGLDGPLFRQDAELDNATEADPWCVLLEYWDEDYSVLVEAGSKLPITEPQRNLAGMKPFFFYTSNPTGDFFLGRGIIEPMSGIQEALNQYENADLDNAISNRHNMFLYDADTKLTADSFTPAPNKAIPVSLPMGRSIDSITAPLFARSNRESNNNVQDRLLNWSERISGVSGQMQGASPERAEAYGTAATQAKEAAPRFSFNITQFSETLAQTARFEFVMSKRWMEQYQVVGIRGRNVPHELVTQNYFPEFTDLDGHPHIKIGPGFFSAIPQGAFEFLPTGAASLASKEFQQQSLMQLIGEMGQDPWIGAQPGQAANPQVVEFTKLLRLREIASLDVTGKETLIRAATAAYDGVIQKMMAPPPPAPAPTPPGASPQPGDGAPAPAGEVPPGPPTTEEKMTPPEQVAPRAVQTPPTLQ